MERLMFSMKRKSGTIRNSCHGVKTKRGSKLFLDCPSVGSTLLLDDIHKLIISFTDGLSPFNYKIESY